MQKQKPDEAWSTKADEARQALAVAHHAKKLAHAVRALSNLETWGKKWEEEADGLITSFEYFLSGDVHPGYRFDAWIDMPQFLFSDMKKTLTLCFEVDVDALDAFGKEMPEVNRQQRGVVMVEATPQALF